MVLRIEDARENSQLPNKTATESAASDRLNMPSIQCTAGSANSQQGAKTYQKKQSP
jgi:hypothetical protein